MRIVFSDNNPMQECEWTFTYLSYSDPQVRYEVGKLRASLDLLNHKGRQDYERKRDSEPGNRFSNPDFYPWR